MKKCVEMNKSHLRYFNKAKLAASVSDYPKIHIGCIAVYQGNIIGIGCNTNKTHPIQKYYNHFRTIDDSSYNDSDSLLPKLHAEINCINSIRYLDINFRKVKLYIYRICHDHPHGMSRPCPSCMAAIKDLGIRNIYYTTDTGFAHEVINDNSAIEKYKTKHIA